MVLVGALLSETGCLEKIQIIESDNTVFDQSAIDAVRRVKFTPVHFSCNGRAMANSAVGVRVHSRQRILSAVTCFVRCKDSTISRHRIR
ncbi:MAG: energy transducer TonB [Ignavibacteria bacterium]|nr:energy transducer TonB [Ignavibacteria bacterium]